jgi:protein associated with RNAse G/E
MDELVEVIKRKFDGSVKSVWEGKIVERDDAWLTVYHDGRAHRKHAGETPADVPPHALRSFWLDHPLAVIFVFDERGRFLQAKCDASPPLAIDGTALSFVDLDLDVVVRPDLSYFTKDEDDFVERSQAMGYGPEVVAAARKGIRLGIELIEKRQPPFDGSAERLLGRILAAEGPL